MRRPLVFALVTISLSLVLSAEWATARPAAEVGARRPGARISPNPTGLHTCAVKEDGTVQCWGNNNQGQLGDGGAPVDQPAPVQVRRLTNVISVATGLARPANH